MGKSRVNKAKELSTYLVGLSTENKKKANDIINLYKDDILSNYRTAENMILKLISRGKGQAKVNDKITTFTAPHIVYIAKDQLHEITALEADTVAYCIHPIRGERQEDIYDHSQVPAGITVSEWNISNTPELSKKFDEAQDV